MGSVHLTYINSFCRFRETEEYISELFKKQENIELIDSTENDHEYDRFAVIDEQLLVESYENNKLFLIKKITNDHDFFKFHNRLEKVVHNAVKEKQLRNELISSSKYKNEFGRKCFPSFEYFVYNKDGSERKLSIPNPLKYAEFIEESLSNLDYFIKYIRT